MMFINHLFISVIHLLTSFGLIALQEVIEILFRCVRVAYYRLFLIFLLLYVH